jgi:protein required for attachment to host cells
MNSFAIPISPQAIASLNHCSCAGKLFARVPRGTIRVSFQFLFHTMVAYERTFVVVIDDTRARFFERTPGGELVEALQNVPLVVTSKGGADARKQARMNFLQSTIGTLSAACNGAGFERLVVIAPERMLSLFRRQIPDTLRARLWRERANETAIVSKEDIARLIALYFR